MNKNNMNHEPIYYARAGSHAFGLNIEGSDEDFKGITIGTRDEYFGFLNHFEQEERLVSKGHEADSVVYEIRKFFNLAANGNPGLLELLFCDEADVITITPAGRRIRDIREQFLSKKIENTFGGYAHSQFHRLKNHRRWLLNPPAHVPSRVEFGLSETHKVSPSEMGAYDELISDGAQFSENVLLTLNKEKAYRSAKRDWDSYQNWKATRNPKRAEMEARFGYDGKHAMHLMRLMRMAREILLGSGVNVKRLDREELLAVRNGAWTYDKLEEQFNLLDVEIKELVKTSSLPNDVNRSNLNRICVDIISNHLNVAAEVIRGEY